MNLKRYKSELATRILKLRRERGLTQQELAKAIGHSQPYVSQIESGTVMPGGETLFELGKALKTPVSKFFPDTVPNRVLGSSLVGLLWIRMRHGWYRHVRNKSTKGVS